MNSWTRSILLVVLILLITIILVKLTVNTPSKTVRATSLSQFAFHETQGTLAEWFVTTLMVTSPGVKDRTKATLLPTLKETQVAEAQPPRISVPPVAFPGAEGFGRDSIGGRGGRLIEVINLNDDGPGSFRAAVEAEGPRIIVFRVAGTIELESSLEINNPYITIAGQTAPGGGITLKNSLSNMGDVLIVRTHDVIIRYIRSRPGPTQERSSNGDAIDILGKEAYNVIIDHSSFSWAIDEVVSTWYDAHDITIQWSIISEGLNCSSHIKGCHSMGMLLGSDGSGEISIHHNLFVHNHQRNPLIKTSGMVDFVNNVIFDTGYTPAFATDVYDEVLVNFIGNYYEPLQNSGSEYLISAASEGGSGLKIFVLGNISPNRPTDNLVEWLVVKPESRQWLVPTRHDAPLVTTMSAFEAYDQVLAGAGATVGLDDRGIIFLRRDLVDERIVNDVKNGRGKIIDDPSEVGGWPRLDEGIASIDSDHDGMPDIWEEIHGFNPDDPSDGPADANEDGYTNIEEYLNGTDPIH